MIRHAFVVTLVAVLTGCTSPYQAPTQPAETAPPVNPIFATQIAGPDTYLPPMPTAVVVLKPDDMARNRALCLSIAKLPTAQEATAKSVVAPNLILTRWLTQLSEVPPDRIRDCDYLVGTYDYSRAAALISSLHGSAGPMTGNGPFLVMMIADNAGIRMIGVDGSAYASAEFDKFVASWNSVISQTQARLSTRPQQSSQPGLVRSIFDLVAAVMRTVFGATAGLVQGTINSL